MHQPPQEPAESDAPAPVTRGRQDRGPHPNNDPASPELEAAWARLSECLNLSATPEGGFGIPQAVNLLASHLEKLIDLSETVDWGIRTLNKHLDRDPKLPLPVSPAELRRLLAEHLQPDGPTHAPALDEHLDQIERYAKLLLTGYAQCGLANVSEKFRMLDPHELEQANRARIGGLARLLPPLKHAQLWKIYCQQNARVHACDAELHRAVGKWVRDVVQRDAG